MVKGSTDLQRDEPLARQLLQMDGIRPLASLNIAERSTHVGTPIKSSFAYQKSRYGIYLFHSSMRLYREKLRFSLCQEKFNHALQKRDSPTKTQWDQAIHHLIAPPLRHWCQGIGYNLWKWNTVIIWKLPIFMTLKSFFSRFFSGPLLKIFVSLDSPSKIGN